MTSQGLRASVRVNAAAVTWEDVEGVRPPRYDEAGTTAPSPQVAVRGGRKVSLLSQF